MIRHDLVRRVLMCAALLGVLAMAPPDRSQQQPQSQEQVARGILALLGSLARRKRASAPWPP